MIFYSPILSLALLQLTGTNARQFTVVNTCTYTIWHVPAPLVILSRYLPRLSDLPFFDGDPGLQWVVLLTPSRSILT